MPRSLKLYIAGVVTLSAVALVVATLVFPVDPRIALACHSDRVSGRSADTAQIAVALGSRSGHSSPWSRRRCL